MSVFQPRKHNLKHIAWVLSYGWNEARCPSGPLQVNGFCERMAMAVSPASADVVRILESGQRIRSLIRKAESKGVAKRKIITFLKKKGVSENKIVEA